MSSKTKYVGLRALSLLVSATFGLSVAAQSPSAARSENPTSKEKLSVISSGRPDFFIEVLDDVSSPQSLETKHGIKAVRVSDLRALIDVIAASGFSAQLCYSVVREQAQSMPCARLSVLPFTEKEPPGVNPDNYVSVDALQIAVDQRELRNREFSQRLEAHLKSFGESRDAFLRNAIVGVQMMAVSARDSAANRSRTAYQASDVAGALKAAADRSRLVEPKVRSILIINSDLEDNVSFRANRTTLTAEEFPQTITVVICVNLSRTPDHSDFLKAKKLELHHRDTLTDAARLVVQLIDRSYASL